MDVLASIQAEIDALLAINNPPGTTTVDINSLKARVTAIETSLENLIVKLSSLSDRIHVVSLSPPDDSPEWRTWLWRRTESGKVRFTYYVRSGSTALPVWDDRDYQEPAPVPTHSNSVIVSPNEYKQDFVAGVSIIYKTKRSDAGQISVRLFATETFSGITWQGFVGGTANGNPRSLTDTTGEENLITPLTQVNSIQLTFVRSDNSVVNYSFLIT